MTFKNIDQLLRDKLQKNRGLVLNALLEIHRNARELDPTDKLLRNVNQLDYIEIGVSSEHLTDYLIEKGLPAYQKELQEIEDKFVGSEHSVKEREIEIKKAKRLHFLSKRTVQRILSDFIEREIVVVKFNRYFLSDIYLQSLRHTPQLLSETIFREIIKVHTPLYNTLEQNIKDLIFYFGSYIFLCLFETSRPINDKYFEAIKLKPMNTDEKNRFTENWLKNLIEPKFLYQRFLETFLNQPNDEMIQKIKRVKFQGIRNGVPIYCDKDGKEYNNLTGMSSDGIKYVTDNGKEYRYELEDLRKLKKVPASLSPIRFSNSISLNKDDEYYYELDEKTFDDVKHTFENLFPDIFTRFCNTGYGNLGWGEKNIQAREYGSPLLPK